MLKRISPLVLATLFILPGCADTPPAADVASDTQPTTQAAQRKTLVSPLGFDVEKTLAEAKARQEAQTKPKEPVAAAPAPAPVPAPPSAPVAGAVIVDLDFPSYSPQSKITARARTVGSDTMDNLANHWWAGFSQFHPNLVYLHEGKGSGTAIPALLDGASDFGPMSRKLNDAETKNFIGRKGYQVTLLPVAVDALAVFVHKDNPLAKTGLTFQQLDAIFSSTRTLGSPDITTWGQLCLTGSYANLPIHVISRNKASGTYGFFKEHVLKKGNFKETNQEKVGSHEVVATVEKDPSAIGYSGIAYKTPGVATVPLADAPGKPFIPADAATAYAGTYPLARYLYIAVDIPPSGKLTDLQREYLAFIYSKEGQQLVAKEGYYPITAQIARENLKKAGITPTF
jgi:phosphate transport system substrate-binding protein